MKSLLVLLTAFSAFVFKADAQQISGVAKDATGLPVNGATVRLLKGNDTTTVKIAVTKENGAFVLSNVAAGNYKIFISHITLKPFVSPAFDFNGKTLQLPELRLPKAEASLGAVTVTSKKPIVEVKADKMIVNVEGTINATGSD